MTRHVLPCSPSGSRQRSLRRILFHHGTTAPSKQAIVAFVTDVTREGSPDFVPASERVATFDNDGTLWIEQPMYVQFVFALDRVKELAPQHPEWKDKQPFKAVLDGDMAALWQPQASTEPSRSSRRRMPA